MIEVAFDVTGRCNRSCIHCGAEEPLKGNIREAPDPSLEDCKQAFDNFKNLGIDYVHFLGGEPALRDDLPLLILEAKRSCLTVGLTTNGTLLSKDLLYQCFANGLTTIVLSFDAPIEEKNDMIRGEGAFAAALKCAELINEYRKEQEGEISLCVRSSLNSFWLDSISLMFELCENIRADELSIKKVRKVGRAKENWHILDFDNDLCFQACEMIAIEASKVHFRVDFPFKPLANYYFNKVNKLQNIRLPAPCSGGNTSFHCFQDGTFVPCTGCAYNNSFPISMAPSVFTPLTSEELENNEYFQLFKNNIRENHQLLQKFVPCNQCPFAGLICSPCPLQSAGKKEKIIVPICAMALEKLKSIEKSDEKINRTEKN